MKTIYDFLFYASSKLNGTTPDPLRDGETILMHVTGKTKEELFTNNALTFTKKNIEDYKKLVEMRSHGKPIQYLTRFSHFYGNIFNVNEHVLIPRPETEQLVEHAIHIGNALSAPTILDVGTGSGCIAISVGLHLPSARITATDISEDALDVARINAERHGVLQSLSLIHSNLLTHLAQTHYDIVIANLPYLPTFDAKKVSKRYTEPIHALDGGFLGIELYQEFFKQLLGFTFTHLLIESDPRNYFQLEQLALDHFPNANIQTFYDLAGRLRGFHLN